MWQERMPEVPAAMVRPSSRHAIACKGWPAPTEAATLLERRSSSISCSSSPADASTWGPARKLTELAAACATAVGVRQALCRSHRPLDSIHKALDSEAGNSKMAVLSAGSAQHSTAQHSAAQGT